MNETQKVAAKAIVQRFAAKLEEFRGETRLILAADQLIEAARTLRAEFNYRMLVDITAVDYWPQETPRFHVVYQLLDLDHNQVLSLRVPLDGHVPALPTLESLFPNANWYEREVWDMFGVRFEGHSDLRRILMPYDWEGHPLRKDYPLGYEEVQFSFNFEEINLRKPYAKE